MEPKLPLPQPIFDSYSAHSKKDWPVPEYVNENDFFVSYRFLQAYDGSADTFNTYRREVDRFLQWMNLVAQKTLTEVERDDIEFFIKFCISPPPQWISTKMVSRFVDAQGIKAVNPEWRPFVVKQSKAEREKGANLSTSEYTLSDKAVQAIFRNLSTYFSFLETEDYVYRNPVKRIRQRSKFTRKTASTTPVRRLSELQWDFVIETAEIMADEDHRHERTLFVMSMLYGLYLRVSELVQSERWSPSMNHFFQDEDGNWWFKTVGKGNKERDITVTQDVISALKRYRQSLGLAALPPPGDSSPLLRKHKGQGAITSTKNIRIIVQRCFDLAVERMKADGFIDESEQLKSATVHWLRHTGISDDVRHRPKEHVRDDAGHASSATTDRYIDIERRERHESGQVRKLRPIH